MIPNLADHHISSSTMAKQSKKKKKHLLLALIPKISKRKHPTLPTASNSETSSAIPQPIPNHQHHLGCLGILHESIILPSKNLLLIFSALVINVVASSLILLFYFLSVNSLIIDLTMKLKSLRTLDPLDPLYPIILAAVLKDVGELTSIEVAFIIISIAIAPFVKTITIYALSVTHCNIRHTFLELLFKAMLSLIRSIATQVLVALLFLGYLAIVGGIVYLLLLVSHWSSLGITISGVVIVLATPPFLYLVTLCTLSVVVAAVEEGFFWKEALFRAMEVMRGRMLQGIFIVIPAIILVVGAALVHAIVHRDAEVDVGLQLAEGYVYIVVSEILNLFILAAVTIYYHECKRLRDEEASSDMYNSLPSDDSNKRQP